MLRIESVSLTALNRNLRLLHTALSEDGLVLLTHYGRTALAVINVERFEQLLLIAEQAAALRDQPDLRQLSKLFQQLDTISLLADREAITEEWAELQRRMASDHNP